MVLNYSADGNTSSLVVRGHEVVLAHEDLKAGRGLDVHGAMRRRQDMAVTDDGPAAKGRVFSGLH